ncbi:MAG: response regulator, partial [Paraburkholderia tropica]
MARAQSVPQLFEEAQQHDFDLAVLDLYMPGERGEEGHDAVQRFQRTYPDKAVVVLTMEDEAAGRGPPQKKKNHRGFLHSP